MESDTSDDDDEKFGQNDWYQARLYSRFTIFSVGVCSACLDKKYRSSAAEERYMPENRKIKMGEP